MKKVSIFVDVQNIYYTTKQEFNLNFDYKALRKNLIESGYIFKIYKVKKFILTFNLGNFMFINYKHSFLDIFHLLLEAW